MNIDDGSGTVTILEAFRVLAESTTFRPAYTVEFHWYSAEEVGLWGSQAVAANYKAQGRPVIGMLQNDMTGFIKVPTFGKPKPHFGVFTDYTDPTLSSFLKKLIESYADMSN